MKYIRAYKHKKKLKKWSPKLRAQNRDWGYKIIFANYIPMYKAVYYDYETKQWEPFHFPEQHSSKMGTVRTGKMPINLNKVPGVI